MSIKGVVSSMLTRISPELNTRVLYYYKFGKRINLKNPQTFHEKLLWLKIYRYNNDPVVKRCADKLRVRDYVIEKTGGVTLNELYAVYDQPEQIEWDTLPNSFVIKSNVASGNNIIVPDKSVLDCERATVEMRTWDENTSGLSHAELQYQDVEHKILIEKYLKGLNGEVPEDYKLYCFNGKVMAVLFISGRFTDHDARAFFDPDWNYLGVPILGGGKYKVREIEESMLPSRPGSLYEMIRTAEQLSHEFPFVRVDFYDINGRAVFGEMTFTPASGFDAEGITLQGKDMGEFIRL